MTLQQPQTVLIWSIFRSGSSHSLDTLHGLISLKTAEFLELQTGHQFIVIVDLAGVLHTSQTMVVTYADSPFPLNPAAYPWLALPGRFFLNFLNFGICLGIGLPDHSFRLIFLLTEIFEAEKAVLLGVYHLAVLILVQMCMVFEVTLRIWHVFLMPHDG